MSALTDRDRESIVATADRHRRLKQAAVGMDAVTHASTRCEGPNTDTETPAFTTELVLSAAFDSVPPSVLEAIADCELGIEDVSPQGSQLIVRLS